MNDMYLAILGRQRKLSLAELEQLYDNDNLEIFGSHCLVKVQPNIDRLGGSPKVTQVITRSKFNSAADIIEQIKSSVKGLLQKSTKAKLGISSYDAPFSAEQLNHLAIQLSRDLRLAGYRVRAVPNRTVALNAAQVWHNRLDKPPNLELVIVTSGNELILARTIGVQDIGNYTRRDRDKPVRDPRVGMLPPKLAKTMINLSGLTLGHLLDPFCGTGTLLMEALLMNFGASGSDLDQRMVSATETNIKWLAKTYNLEIADVKINTFDAQTAVWPQPIDAVVSETYLGPPLSNLEDGTDVSKIASGVNALLKKTLTNLAVQLQPDTPLCLAIPAWYDRKSGNYSCLPLVDELSTLGYNLVDLKSVKSDKLIYHRPDQTVARQLLIMRKQ